MTYEWLPEQIDRFDCNKKREIAPFQTMQDVRSLVKNFQLFGNTLICLPLVALVSFREKMKPLMRYSSATEVLEYLTTVFECLIWYLFGTPAVENNWEGDAKKPIPLYTFTQNMKTFWMGCLLPMSFVVEPPWLFKFLNMDFQTFETEQFSNYLFQSRSKQHGKIAIFTKCTSIFFKIVLLLFLSLIKT